MPLNYRKEETQHSPKSSHSFPYVYLEWIFSGYLHFSSSYDIWSWTFILVGILLIFLLLRLRKSDMSPISTLELYRIFSPRVENAKPRWMVRLHIREMQSRKNLCRNVSCVWGEALSAWVEIKIKFVKFFLFLFSFSIILFNLFFSSFFFFCLSCALQHLKWL